MYIKLSFSDTVDWTIKSSGQKQMVWDLGGGNYFTVNAVEEARLVPELPLDERITDVWNGNKFNVFTHKWDVFSCYFFCKETQFYTLSQIKYAKTGQIYDQFGNLYTIDLSSSDYVTFTGEKIDITDNLKCTLTIRCNLVEIDYCKVARLGAPTTFTINSSKPIDAEFTALGNTKAISSDLDAIPVILDEVIEEDEQNARKFIDKITNKSAYLVRFYLSNTDKNIIQKYIKMCDSATLQRQGSPVPALDTIIEQRIKECSQVANDLWMLDLELIVTANIFYPHA
jgi:hypothetical protein